MSNPKPELPPPPKLRLREWVKDLVPYSDGSLDNLIAEHRFPAPVRMGPRRIAWVESEVRAWLDARIRERDDLHLVADL